jgi:hypothetical protein
MIEVLRTVIGHWWSSSIFFFFFKYSLYLDNYVCISFGA